jgi:hypothetical protein
VVEENLETIAFQTLGSCDLSLVPMVFFFLPLLMSEMYRLDFNNYYTKQLEAAAEKSRAESTEHRSQERLLGKFFFKSLFNV